MAKSEVLETCAEMLSRLGKEIIIVFYNFQLHCVSASQC